MAVPSKNLPFEYTQRWKEVGGLFAPPAAAEAIERLEERDRNLEDFLASLEFGGACDTEVMATSWSGWTIPATSTNTFAINTVQAGGFYSPNGQPPLPAGIWQCNISLTFNLIGGPTSINGVEVKLDNPESSASDHGYAVGHFYDSTYDTEAFSLVVWATSTWTPTLLGNNLTADDCQLDGYFTAVKFCDPAGIAQPT